MEIKPEGKICELCCNLDDITSEELSYAQEKLFEGGALDAFVSPIYMKKNRAAFLLSCICKTEDADKLAYVMFKHTSTLGVRKKDCERYELKKTAKSVSTKYGEIALKLSEGFGIKKIKAEYDSLKKAADKFGVSIKQVREAAEAQAREENWSNN